MPTLKVKNSRKAIGKGHIVVFIAAGCAAVAAVVLARHDPWKNAKDDLPDSFQLQVPEYYVPAAEEIGYHEELTIPVTNDRVHAIAVGMSGDIYVGGNDLITVWDMTGNLLREWHVDGTTMALAAAGDDDKTQVYVALEDRILQCDGTGQIVGTLADGDGKAVFTCVVAGPDGVFAADAAHRVVYQWDADGTLRRTFSGTHADDEPSGFVVPSPQFDCVVSDGMVHIVNPGKRQIESYSISTGDLESVWGETGSGKAGFFGCCNPSHLALLSDGRFVTSEKGISRIKVHDVAGQFVAFVAGAEQLDVKLGATLDSQCCSNPCTFDVAVANDCIYVLDPFEKKVRVFVENGAQ
ncbi:MAG: hypothetical protein R3E01_31690 [Pirellulaceae bacterium]|nr:hypothetical protein [Planctomycetales bacterium]